MNIEYVQNLKPQIMHFRSVSVNTSWLSFTVLKNVILVREQLFIHSK